MLELIYNNTHTHKKISKKKYFKVIVFHNNIKSFIRFCSHSFEQILTSLKSSGLIIIICLCLFIKCQRHQNIMNEINPKIMNFHYRIASHQCVIEHLHFVSTEQHRLQGT